MSYLLDALQKSEQERGDPAQTATAGTGATPAGRSATDYLPEPSFLRDEPPRRLWPLVAIAALLLNTGLLAWLILRPTPPAPPAPAPTVIVQPIQVPAPATAPASTAAPVAPAASDPGIEVRTPDNGGVELVTEIKKDAPLPASDAPISTFAELPADLRTQLPALSMQSHLYTANPATSSVMINDRNLSAGDRLNEQIRLEAVTAEGAILRIGDYRVKMASLSKWSPDETVQ